MVLLRPSTTVQRSLTSIYTMANVLSVDAFLRRSCTTVTHFLRHYRSKQSVLTTWRTYPIAEYAKKAGKGVGPEVKELMEVNTNPEDLLKYCCGASYFKEGPEIELKPDDEYPDWLWDLHIGPPLKLEELDPESHQYWRRLRKMDIKRQNKLSKGKKF